MIIKKVDLFTVEPADRPLNSGHVIISSERPIDQLSDKELVELAKLIQELVGKMKRAYNPEGYNIVLWDNRIEMWPRWCGDISFNAFYGLKTTPQTAQMILETYK
ncbi:HIT family protein [Thermoproteus tenax]|uniref:HIT family hydrolase n=1 Tax=Thermoproteus tenax (strain ATCC 35583 / DSM 2078 / JCM 9277 / NBRC 100435 / Kra 1) TaxID=768679 RepID=G4RKL8_THETK|nr:diadenosine tetraphosphate hydrolase [Thermoproteus tenax]CCC82113.1 HIT family hydrolase [Thermoproteus tenax Kra 1]